MRPVRFVALSEDGQALVLTDEVGRLLALPIDDRVHGALRPESERGGTYPTLAPSETASLSPRDIQARIRSGESADDVARVAGVPVDRVLRYAGPVLQERAMLAQYARRTKLRTSDRGATLAEVVDGRLAQHGIDTEKISWDASRREDGTWRVMATWPSGKATAQATWELDKARQLVTPSDDMAQYLCTDRIAQPGHDLTDRVTHGHGIAGPTRGETSRGELGRGELGRGELGRGDFSRGHTRDLPSRDREALSRDPLSRDPLTRDGARSLVRGEQGREAAREPAARGHGPLDAPIRGRESRQVRPANDPIRAGRDALLASLERPLTPTGRTAESQPTPGASTTVPAAGTHGKPADPARPAARGGAASLISSGSSAFEEPGEPAKDVPSVPSLAVLRPRRTSTSTSSETGDKPRKRLPSWDDVLFGGGATARESG